MKAHHLLLLLMITLAVAVSAEPKLTLTHLRGGVYIVQDGFYSQENSAVYVGDDHVTVIGATWTPETAAILVGEIGKITPKPVLEVINTNYHPDRAGGNSYFKRIGARIIATSKTVEMMRTGWDSVVTATRASFPSFPLLPLELPDAVLPPDFAVQNGAVQAVYTGESHTPDGIFVYFPQEKVLYGSCILKERLGNLDYANLSEYPKTLQRLQALKLGFTTIIAGHFSPIHGPELIDRYLTLLAER